MPSKRCTRCKVTKKPWEFTCDASRGDGLQARCIACQAEVQATRQASGKSQIMRTAYHATTEGRAKRREQNRRDKIWRIFGITLERYNEIMAAADTCDMCGASFDEARVRNLDHDHNTKQIRGVLCGPCNRGLGQLGDNEAGLLRALEYVRNARYSSFAR